MAINSTQYGVTNNFLMHCVNSRQTIVSNTMWISEG